MPALRAGADDLVLELLGLPPLSDAWQAEAVGAIGKDPKPAQSGNLRLANISKIGKNFKHFEHWLW